jgi:hypothetical protein
VSGVMSPAVRGSKGGGDTMVMVGKEEEEDDGAPPVADAAVESRPGVGSGGLRGVGGLEGRFQIHALIHWHAGERSRSRSIDRRESRRNRM